MTVLTDTTSVALWRDIVHEAEAICETTLQHELEAYLVFLLNRYLNKPDIGKLTMASELMQALQYRATARDTALQGVGDTCLLFSGFFSGLAEKRLVKISYFIRLGQGAYFSISKERNDLYARLSQQFVSIMDILQTIRRHTQQELAPLTAYDLWNETGSQHALKVLKKYSKATPINVPAADGAPGLIKIK